MSAENIMRMFNDCVTGGSVRPKLRVVAKTSSYTVTPTDFGTVLTTRGASAAVTFTLPAVSSNFKGEWALFINIVDYDMIVSATDGEMVTFNDAAASNIGFVTSGEKIGGMLLAMCDGTSWLVMPIGTETQTISVDTSPSRTPSHTPSRTPSRTPSTT